MGTIFAFEPAPEHQYPGHPENPERLNLLRSLLPSMKAARIEGRAASLDEVMRVHDSPMLQSLVDACKLGRAVIDPAPTYLTRASMDAALRAAGATVECARAVWCGKAENAFAIVRPPGHHAEPDRAMGFCLLNNVAIAAASVLAEGAGRVAIIDYDAHHGNGTQAAFLREPRVAFVSMHQWGIYPGTGWFEEVPDARGRIVNVPLPARSGDRSYMQVADMIIEPMLRRFQPDLMLVSTGFDAHWNDPITALGLSSSGFHRLSRRLIELAEAQCQGRIVFVLEGGYEPLNVLRGAQAVLAALTDSPFEDPGDASPYKDPEPVELVDKIAGLHGLRA